MWASMTDADSYMLGRLGGELWSSLSDDQRHRALTTAYRILSTDKDYNFSPVPSASMIAAQIELAFVLATDSDVMQSIDLQRSGVSSMSIGRFSVSYSTGQMIATYPSHISSLMHAYRTGLSSGRVVRQ